MVSTNPWLAKAGITAFPYAMAPMNNITPLTYRDGITYLKMLEALSAWVQNTVAVEFQEAIEKAFEDFQEGITNAEDTIIASKLEWQTLFDDFMEFVTERLEALNDDAVSNLVADELSKLRVALNANFADKETQVTVEEGRLSVGGVVAEFDRVSLGRYPYSIARDGVTDVSAIINQAAADVLALPGKCKLVIPPGVYNIGSTTVNISCSLDADGATLNYSGSGTALVIGSPTPGVITFRRKFVLPRLVKSNRIGYWDGGSTGVKLNNLNTCFVEVPFIQDFTTGLHLYGEGGGNAYNNIYLGALWENQKNLVLNCADDGYTNQNTFFGGRLQHSTTKGAFLNDPNACQIYMVNAGAGGPNNNAFYNTSIEGESVGLYRVDMSGRYNMFHNVRWESGTPKIRYRPFAKWNVIDRGYNTQSVEEIFDNGSQGGGSIDDYIGSYSSSNGLITDILTTGVEATLAGWGNPVGRRVSYANGVFTPRPGRWLVSVTMAFAPNPDGRRVVKLMKNAVASKVVESIGYVGSTKRLSLQITDVILIAPGDTISVRAMQDSGVDLGFTQGGYCKINLEYLGG